MDEAKRRSSAKADPILRLERYDRRRRIVNAMVGATIAGALGYGSYPWIVGDRRQALADGLAACWQRLREGYPGRGESDLGEVRVLPVLLDAEGRDYETFLTQLNLRHIQPVEMLRPHFKMRGNVCNTLPPRDHWKNMVPTLRVADELRERLGVPLATIASAYRSPAYNATCPGAAAHSYHTRNMALDLVFDCASEKVAKAAETLRTEGFFAGGIGRYPGFTHVDTRGKSADWG
ncbi:hypothetical protein AYO49_04885 [Verrucomicrobiaceae bacterium SCGC AG-212-N21]|nr:hypothetical protein AYO49_04885 [Verrucomicrobiaceae bacterium SCGC AG-212-N21]